MKIGYQGMQGSNAEVAAKQMAQKLNFNESEVEYIPLISSKNVLGSLKRNEIEYGVVATKNSKAGTVIETFEAIKNEYLELVATEILRIHHCLFKKSKDVDNDSLKFVASHIQALKQTRENRKKLFPQMEEIEIEDTAIGAKRLANNELDEDVAIICRKEAGEFFNLELIKENIEDDCENYTEFRMFKLPSLDYSNRDKAGLLDAIKYECINERGLGILSKFIIIISVFIAFYISEYLSLSKWDTATLIGGYVSVVILFITSNRLREKFRFNSIKGYWKYYSIPDKVEPNAFDQKYEVPRIVEIDEIDGELLFRGYICDKENIPLFESYNVLISSLGKCKGSLVYWYGNPQERNRGYNVNGIVELNWKNKDVASKINQMSGSYMGKATKETGSIVYLRITEEEFNVHRKSDFL